MVEETVRSGEKIFLFGDGDLDGISSVVILEEVLAELGSPPSFVYFGNRQKYRHGLSLPLFEVIRDKGPGLLILLDCGVTNKKSVKEAKKEGFKVLIIDHHPAVEGEPEADVIIDPKLEGEKEEILCTGGIAFKFAQLLTENEKVLKEASILAMLATLSDQMPWEGENEKIIEKGLSNLEDTERVFFKFLIQENDLTPPFTQGNAERGIISVLSAAHQRDYESQLYKVLKLNSWSKARRVGDLLIQRNQLQKQRVEEIIGEVQKEAEPASLIFKGDKDWPLFLAARAASYLVKEYKVPVFLYNRGKEESQGSVRGPSKIDVVELMKPCRDLLLNFGGHPRAAGFGLKNENLNKFKDCLEKQLEKYEME